MKKFFKKIVGAGMAMVLAGNMMSFNVSASNVTTGNWKVYYAPGAGGMNVSSKTFEFCNLSKKIYGINSSCTKYYSDTDSIGRQNRIKYWAYAVNENGNAGQGSNIGTKYHSRVESKNRDLSNPMSTNLTLVVKYNSELSLVKCDIKGSTYVYYSWRE